MIACQVVFMTSLKVEPPYDKDKGIYVLTADKLPSIINPIEGGIGECHCRIFTNLHS